MTLNWTLAIILAVVTAFLTFCAVVLWHSLGEITAMDIDIDTDELDEAVVEDYECGADESRWVDCTEEECLYCKEDSQA